jgi:hypothetical protein
MKKLIIILFVSLFAMAAMAQRGVLNTVAADTLNGNETVNFQIGTTINGSYNTLCITALCTNIGGTSDGTLALHGSNDGTNYVLVNGVGGGVITASPVASLTGADLNQLTITNGLVANWIISPAFKYYRVPGVGTASDSTLIEITYVYK